jgi:hypothetical protein
MWNGVGGVPIDMVTFRPMDITILRNMSLKWSPGGRNLYRSGRNPKRRGMRPRLGRNLLGSDSEVRTDTESITDQVDRVNAEFAIFIQVLASELCISEALNFAKALAEYSLVGDGSAEMIVAKVA